MGVGTNAFNREDWVQEQNKEKTMLIIKIQKRKGSQAEKDNKKQKECLSKTEGPGKRRTVWRNHGRRIL